MTVWLQIEGRQRKVELRSAVEHAPAEAGQSSAKKDGLGGALACVVDGRPLTVEAQLLRPGVLSLLVDGRQYCCILDGDAVLVDGRRYELEVVDPRSLQARHGAGAAAEGARAVKAPMPGRVVRVLVGVGDEVKAQQGLVVIEAMKMQNELKSPKAGRIVRIATAVGDTVQAGGVLVVVE